MPEPRNESMFTASQAGTMFEELKSQFKGVLEIIEPTHKDVIHIKEDVFQVKEDVADVKDRLYVLEKAVSTVMPRLTKLEVKVR